MSRAGLPREAPVTRIQRFLLPGEQIVYCNRRHPLQMLDAAWRHAKSGLISALVGAALVFLLARTGGAVVVGALAGLLFWASAMVFEWWETQFVLTDRRVLLITEPLPVNVRFIALPRVVSVRFEQGLIGRWFNYGTFGIDNAAPDHPLGQLRFTRRTDELYRALSVELFGEAGGRIQPEF